MNGKDLSKIDNFKIGFSEKGNWIYASLDNPKDAFYHCIKKMKRGYNLIVIHGSVDGTSHRLDVENLKEANRLYG